MIRIVRTSTLKRLYEALQLRREQVRLQNEVLEKDQAIIARLENQVQVYEEHLKVLTETIVRQDLILDTIYSKITTAGRLRTQKCASEIPQ